jgi:hypothetical protein
MASHHLLRNHSPLPELQSFHFPEKQPKPLLQKTVQPRLENR